MRIINRLKDNLKEIKKKAFAILIYGSYAEGKANAKSDIDVCVVAKSSDKIELKKLHKEVLRASAKDIKYDVRIFEEMPLYMKAEVIETGKVIYAKSLPKLYEYFYFYRKLWKDQSLHWVEKEV